MAEPQLITITGKFTRKDGTPESGTVEFQVPGLLRSQVYDESKSPGRFVATLDESGMFTLLVWATDDPNWTPANWTYKVIISLSNFRTVMNASIPIASPAYTLDLADILPALSPSEGQAYAPISHTHEGTGGPGGAVDSVNGRTGAVVLTKSDVGLSNVDNTTDANKPVSSATQTALNLKANLASPTFTGTVSGITKSMVGLGNVDNISDANKPVSTATQAALDLKANASAVTTALAGKADLVGGFIPTAQIPAIAITEVFPVASQAAMLALTAQRGDMALRTDNGHRYVLSTDSPGTLADWVDLGAATDLVASVNGQTGVVVLAKADIGLGNVDNTSDANKPVSTAQQSALNLKANLASPTFTGTVSGITKSMVGLGNVDNTADSAKPVSTAQQTALDGKPDVYQWNGTTYVLVTTGDIFVGPSANDPATYVTVGNGSVWVKTT